MFFVGFFFTSADSLYQSFLTLIQFWGFFAKFWHILKDSSLLRVVKHLYQMKQKNLSVVLTDGPISNHQKRNDNNSNYCYIRYYSRIPI